MIVVPGLLHTHTHTHTHLCVPLTEIYIMRVTEGDLDFFIESNHCTFTLFFLGQWLEQSWQRNIVTVTLHHAEHIKDHMLQSVFRSPLALCSPLGLSVMHKLFSLIRYINSFHSSHMVFHLMEKQGGQHLQSGQEHAASFAIHGRSVGFSSGIIWIQCCTLPYSTV